MELGKMPNALVAMLRLFNGAQLFFVNGPAVSLFGITPTPPLPPLESAPDWHIEVFTPAWRNASPGREHEWTIAMMSYGVLIILDRDGIIKQFERNTRTWDAAPMRFDEWIDDQFKEGNTMLDELKNDSIEAILRIGENERNRE
jgi:hypothetical protein